MYYACMGITGFKLITSSYTSNRQGFGGCLPKGHSDSTGSLMCLLYLQGKLVISDFLERSENSWKFVHITLRHMQIAKGAPKSHQKIAF